MIGLLKSRERVLSVCVAAVAVTALAVGLAVGFADEGSAVSDTTVADKAAIESVIAQCEAVDAQAYVVPRDAVAVVEARRAAIYNAKDWAPVADGEACPSVIPSGVAKEMDANYAAGLGKCCSARFVDSMMKNMPAARSVNEALYNCPSEPLLVDIEKEVMATECVRSAESGSVVWAYVWNGDVTTRGRDVQGWAVWEYSLVKEGGRWVIDGRKLLGCLEARTATGELVSDEWGSGAPHAGVDELFGPLCSEVCTDRNVLLQKLRDLETRALASI